MPEMLWRTLSVPVEEVCAGDLIEDMGSWAQVHDVTVTPEMPDLLTRQQSRFVIVVHRFQASYRRGEIVNIMRLRSNL